MKILILFPQGCYGSFVAWMLANANKKLTEDDLPFNPSGNAHKIFHHPETFFDLHDETDLDDFLSSECTFGTVHPGKTANMLDKLQDGNVCKLIVIGYNNASKVWMMNNQYTKQYKNWLFHHENYNFQQHMKFWGIKPIHEYPIWQIREGLSSYLEHIDTMPSWVRERFNFIDNHQNGIYFDVTELRDNFKQTLIKMAEYCELPYNTEAFDFVEPIWRVCQYHFYKDDLINRTVTNLINNKDFNITVPLTLVDEAYIQGRLRKLGAELLCYNMDKMPTSGDELRKFVTFNFDTLVKNDFNKILTQVYNKQIEKDKALDIISNILDRLT